MNIKQIEYVLAVAEYKSFTKAAEKLFISQPALSEQIKLLETELGIQIFNRSKNGVTLTQTGKEFVLNGNNILNQFYKFESSMKNYSTNLIGTIRIGLYWAFGYTDIPEKLFNFLKENPKITAIFTIDGSVNLEEKLNNKLLDIAFVTGYNDSFNDNNLKNVFIESSQLVALVNYEHALGKKNQIHFKDLTNQTILNISSMSNLYEIFNKYLKKYTTNVKSIGESSQMDVAYQIAKNNLGISFVSEEVAKTLEDDFVKYVSVSPPIYRNIYLIYHKNKKNNPILKELIKTFS